MTGNIQTSSSSEPRVHRMQNQNVPLIRTRSLANLNSSVHSNQQTGQFELQYITVHSGASLISNISGASSSESPDISNMLEVPQQLPLRNAESGAYSVNQGSVSPKGYIPREIATQHNPDEISEVSIEIPHMLRSSLFDSMSETSDGNSRTELLPQRPRTPPVNQGQSDGMSETSDANSRTELLPQRPRTFPVNVGQLPLEEHNKCLPRCTIL